MVEVVITGIGCWTGLGNLTQTWQNLLSGNSSITLQKPFLELPPYPLSLLKKEPTSLKTITEKVVQDALADAKLSLPLPNCGVAVGSSRGCQGEWEKWAQNRETPLNWLDTLPQQSAVTTAQIVGARGNVLSPMAACSTGIWTIAQGFNLIQTGEYEQVIAGAVESPITPLILTGFAKMGALAKTGCYPFDEQREGLVLGEGGAVFILESLASARKRNALIYGEIIGYGVNCDAYHVSAPNPDYHCATKLIQSCLEKGNVSPHEINYIHAHGTSTQLNDQREAALIESLFPSQVPVSSTKGATGHTLGASSAIGVALTLKSLQTQILPPCVGLTNSEFPLNFVRESISSNINYALVLSFGFGGQNGGILLKK
ncbi:beta-ketoacyl-ACP synthase [Euhalothece natronophila Z-M001]|uniref:Beta-ketoacyl-ACP synthase n=1 Tax=Euhalothece natronophila Z-M001 TaxID=522448 RepID=A0A5B8NPI9_9CHRO|nr:beta-ketoacyl-ACP synthase [Euhalothece natronophila]QDZ40948.1 beta-ketoacyl-ACP synthase [Euhalothece natronophila Z-M001]